MLTDLMIARAYLEIDKVDIAGAGRRHCAHQSMYHRWVEAPAALLAWVRGLVGGSAR